MIRLIAVLLLFAAALMPARGVASTCYAFVEGLPDVRYASLELAVAPANEVKITYVTHSTFRIESAAGVSIATDFFGPAGPGGVPTVVTMNKAHETHFTNFPDPAIEHVLRGWGTEGDKPAEHLVEVEDVVIRNVTTDIQRWGPVEPNANSIFVVEVADICIGHLGHLHHALTDEHYALLGRMDVVMAPVDGSFTLDIGSMIDIMKRLKAQLVLPMHAFGPASMRRFLDGMADEFKVVVNEEPSVTVGRATLPSEPTVMLLPSSFGHSYE